MSCRNSQIRQNRVGNVTRYPRIVRKTDNTYWLLEKDGTVKQIDSTEEVAKIVGISETTACACPDGSVYNGHRVFKDIHFDPQYMLKTWDRDELLQSIPSAAKYELVAIDLETEQAFTFNCSVEHLANTFGMYRGKVKEIANAGGVIGKCCWLRGHVYDRMVQDGTLKDFIMTVRYILKLMKQLDVAWKRKAKLIDKASGI